MNELGEPSVGVLITAYNGAHVVDQTLAAIATQTRRPDQVVLVDDASSDDTAARARRWQNHLPLEVLVQPRNGGVARARNRGAERLCTDLVAILDGDDIALADHLRVMTRLHAQVGGIISPLVRFWTPNAPRTPYQRRVRGLTVPRHDQLRALIHKNYVFVGSLLARQALEEVGGYTEGDRWQDFTADWDLWLRLVAAGHSIAQAPVPTVLYRVSPSSMAADSARLLEGDLHQLSRTRALVPASLHDEVDRAIANRRAELAVLAAQTDGAKLELAALAVGRHGGDARNRARAAFAAVAPRSMTALLRQRGSW